MKKIILLFTLLSFNFYTEAQDAVALKDTSWKKSNQLGFNINQGTFSDNFQGSSLLSSLGIGAYFNTTRNYLKDKTGWDNTVQLKYGTLANRDKSSSAADVRKSIDVIFLDSKYTKKIAPKWHLFANVNFLSQFSNTFDNGYKLKNGTLANIKRSGLFSPAYITESIGLQYTPSKFFNIQFAPGAFRQTIVSDLDQYKLEGNEKNYGVERGKKVRSEMAIIQIIANYNKEIAKNINLSWRYMAYASASQIGEIDDRLDLNLTAKVNKNINLNLGVIGIYDNDQSGKLQLAQSINLGFLFSL